ncbi:MAG: S46 family peptidase [Bacteroidia bacterium]
MKNYILLVLFVISRLVAIADEGMWLPMLLKQLNEKDMKSMGMKISAEDIYSVNKSSMKDAVALFGRGCTAEVISSEGLLLTNHHCGFGQIQDHSSLENDYLKDGFWAMNKSEELTNPGLTVTFIVSMEDVTTKLLEGIDASLSEDEREAIISGRALELVSKAKENTHYEAQIKSFYNGNEYILITTEVFKDIRLVGAPPQSIGNFGKDSDNWVWPRHTADFSIFRIYAGPDNKPADYSPDNKPYKPRYHFKVSTSGISENDFTMVYGFPARTNEYLTSYAVDQIVNVSNPLKVELRGKRLDVMNEYMNADRAVFIKYADKYSGVSNYHKKWAGEAKGLTKASAIKKKKDFENEFTRRVNESSAYLKYNNLIPEFEKAYKIMQPVQFELDLFSEGLLSSEIIRFAYSMRNLESLNKSESNTEGSESIKENAIKIAKDHFKDYYRDLDRSLSKVVFYEYYAKSNMDYSPDYQFLKSESTKEQVYNSVDSLFAQSIFDDELAFMNLLSADDSIITSALNSDPAYSLAKFYYDKYYTEVIKEYRKINNELIPLNRKYVEALRVVIPEKKYYPDANQSLRVAYGKAEGYEPADGVEYEWFTTASGILEKNNTGHADYEIPVKLRNLIETKDFGQYADKNGELRTCFAASNHTTGGNSGSPVLNAKGELIGTNFDRNWEGTMSDVYYDINQVRNITVDIRYTMFIIDKFAGAGHLINEMSLVK